MAEEAYGFSGTDAQRIASAVRRLEGKPVNDPVRRVGPHAPSGTNVQIVLVTSTTKVNGLYPCKWCDYQPAGNQTLSQQPGYVLDANGGPLATVFYLAKLVAIASDGLPIFEMALPDASEMQAGLVNLVAGQVLGDGNKVFSDGLTVNDDQNATSPFIVRAVGASPCIQTDPITAAVGINSAPSGLDQLTVHGSIGTYSSQALNTTYVGIHVYVPGINTDFAYLSAGGGTTGTFAAVGVRVGNAQAVELQFQYIGSIFNFSAPAFNGLPGPNLAINGVQGINGVFNLGGHLVTVTGGIITGIV